MSVSMFVLFLYITCLSAGCSVNEAERPSTHAAQKESSSGETDPRPWNGVKLEYFDTSHPDYYQLSVRVKDPRDRRAYQLSFVPPLPVTIDPLNDKDSVIQQHRIDMRKISLGHHTFEARFTHQDGRVHSEEVSFHRQPVLFIDPQGMISCKPAQCSGQVNWSGLINIKVEPGTKVVFDQNVVVAQEDPIQFKLDILGLATKVHDLFQTSDIPSTDRWILQKKLMLIFPNKTRTDYMIKWDRKRALSAVKDMLTPLRSPNNTTGVMFPGERSSQRRGRGPEAKGLLILPQFASRNIKRVTDIKWVAFVDEHSRSQDCGSYRNLKTNQSRVVSIQYTDLKVKMFNRHTGQQVSQRTFRAPLVPCPKRKSISLGVKSNVNFGDVFAWLNQRVN